MVPILPTLSVMKRTPSLQSKDVFLQDLINQVFPDMSFHSLDSDFLCSRSILTTKNSTVDSVNEVMKELFPGESLTYSSADSVDDDSQSAMYPSEFLNSLTPSGLPPHHLILNVNAPVMLLRNLDPARGLFNGTCRTRLIIHSLCQHVIECESAGFSYQ